MRGNIIRFLEWLGLSKPARLKDPKNLIESMWIDKTNLRLATIKHLMELSNFNVTIIDGDHLVIENNGDQCELRVSLKSGTILLSNSFIFKNGISKKEQNAWLDNHFMKRNVTCSELSNNRLTLIESIESLNGYPANYVIERVRTFLETNGRIEANDPFKYITNSNSSDFEFYDLDKVD